MSWRAIFLDGPMKGKEHDRLMFGAWQRELYFAPFAVTDASPDGWFAVGSDQTGRPDIEGTVHYVRNDKRSQLIKDEDWHPGEDEGWAAYEEVP